MPFLLKELIKAGIYISILTSILYYFVDNKLSTAFIVALVNREYKIFCVNENR